MRCRKRDRSVLRISSYRAQGSPVIARWQPEINQKVAPELNVQSHPNGRLLELNRRERRQRNPHLGRLQATTSMARCKMRVSRVASFIRCFSANSARYKSVNCLLDCAAIPFGEKSSGINRQRCFRTNSERAFRQGSGSARNGNVSPLLIRKSPVRQSGRLPFVCGATRPRPCAGLDDPAELRRSEC
jgi:hypothetical protein